MQLSKEKYNLSILKSCVGISAGQSANLRIKRETLLEKDVLAITPGQAIYIH